MPRHAILTGCKVRQTERQREGVIVSERKRRKMCKSKIAANVLAIIRSSQKCWPKRCYNMQRGRGRKYVCRGGSQRGLLAATNPPKLNLSIYGLSKQTQRKIYSRHKISNKKTLREKNKVLCAASIAVDN